MIKIKKMINQIQISKKCASIISRATDLLARQNYEDMLSLLLNEDALECKKLVSYNLLLARCYFSMENYEKSKNEFITSVDIINKSKKIDNYNKNYLLLYVYAHLKDIDESYIENVKFYRDNLTLNLVDKRFLRRFPIDNI